MACFGSVAFAAAGSCSASILAIGEPKALSLLTLCSAQLWFVVKANTAFANSVFNTCLMLNLRIDLLKYRRLIKSTKSAANAFAKWLGIAFIFGA